MKMENSPVISVITVTFNAVDTVEKTIMSVIGQENASFESIVIDGGSTDGTCDVIKKYQNGIDYFVSEPDGGIYYGMNKGIAAARGEYVIFMNAGDVFADSSVLSDIIDFAYLHKESDVIFGDTEQIFEYGSYRVSPSAACMNAKMAVSHQASFVRTELLRSHPFDVRYKYAADYEQLSSFYLEGRIYTHCPRLIARVDMTDGATYRHFLESAGELYDIMESRGINVRNERKKAIRRKKIVRFVRRTLPLRIRIPLFRFIADHYKAL